GAPPSDPGAGVAPQVSVRIDDTRRVRALVDAKGGVVETTGADGTRYTLTIPAGALASPETVRVAPLLAVAGLGGVAGVSLLPAGLRLLAPATLAVAPARAAVGFAFRGGGAALH